MWGRPFGDRRSGRNAAERGIAIVFKEKRMPRRHPFVLAGSVSRVLYSAARFRCGAPVIYLRRRSPAASSNLPPDIGRATLNCRYTRSCNPSDVRPATSLPPRWALTPPFHPYPCQQGRSFSVTFPITARLSSRYLGRCSALPGLSSPPRGAATRRACTTKVRKK